MLQKTWNISISFIMTLTSSILNYLMHCQQLHVPAQMIFRLQQSHFNQATHILNNTESRMVQNVSYYYFFAVVVFLISLFIYLWILEISLKTILQFLSLWPGWHVVGPPVMGQGKHWAQWETTPQQAEQAENISLSHPAVLTKTSLKPVHTAWPLCAWFVF